MDNNETICAVVVTFNRKTLLSECLRGLFKQTVPLNAIYLVDNASIDGTHDMLYQEGYLKNKIQILDSQRIFITSDETQNRKIKFYYLRLPENKGGAGGFYEGLEQAYFEGYHWFWIMDDDVEPLENALKIQLQYKNISKCIHPSKIYLNGDRYFWEGSINELDGFEYFKEDEFLKYSKNFTVVNMGNFEGMLIHRDIVEKIGFPQRELFMIGDDTRYGYYASKYTLNIYIKDICFIKKLDGRGKVKSILKRYLDFRNKYASFSRQISHNKLYWLLSFFSITIRKLGSSIIKRKRPLEFYYILRGSFDGLRDDFNMKIVRKLLR